MPAILDINDELVEQASDAITGLYEQYGVLVDVYENYYDKLKPADWVRLCSAIDDFERVIQSVHSQLTGLAPVIGALYERLSTYANEEGVLSDEE